jgi:type II secretory pathway pseudopilin PulG
MRARGFTIVEATVVVGVVAILTAMSAVGISRLTRSSRTSGERFTVMSSFTFARSRAVAMGRDVYVLFANVDKASVAPAADAPQVLVYDDADLQLRAWLADPDNDPMAVVNANPGNIRDRFVATSTSGLFFRGQDTANVSSCNLAKIPLYLPITGARRTQQDCAPAFCTFCRKYGSTCVGAVRYSADGVARLVTGPSGSGGLIKLVQLDDPTHSICLAISEPAGATSTIPD